jgi:hypothetical protein
MSNENTSPVDTPTTRPRRTSFTSNTFTSLFGRSPSTSGPSSVPTGPAAFPGPIATAANDHRRRVSISTLGLSGTSPTTPYTVGRRASISTAGSESIDENAIDDDDGPSRRDSNPTTPFGRRLSFGAQAFRNARSGSGSPGTSGISTSNPPPALSRRVSVSAALAGKASGTQDQASTYTAQRTFSDKSLRSANESFNWPEQLRSRAENTATRASFSNQMRPAAHERARSGVDMPVPPLTVQPMAPVEKDRRPDAFQERMLKGDFCMD